MQRVRLGVDARLRTQRAASGARAAASDTNRSRQTHVRARTTVEGVRLGVDAGARAGDSSRETLAAPTRASTSRSAGATTRPAVIAVAVEIATGSVADLLTGPFTDAVPSGRAGRTRGTRRAPCPRGFTIDDAVAIVIEAVATFRRRPMDARCAVVAIVAAANPWRVTVTVAVEGIRSTDAGGRVATLVGGARVSVDAVPIGSAHGAARASHAWIAGLTRQASGGDRHGTAPARRAGVLGASDAIVAARVVHAVHAATRDAAVVGARHVVVAVTVEHARRGGGVRSETQVITGGRVAFDGGGVRGHCHLPPRTATNPDRQARQDQDLSEVAKRRHTSLPLNSPAGHHRLFRVRCSLRRHIGPCQAPPPGRRSRRGPRPGVRSRRWRRGRQKPPGTQGAQGAQGQRRMGWSTKFTRRSAGAPGLRRTNWFRAPDPSFSALAPLASLAVSASLATNAYSERQPRRLPLPRDAASV